LLFDLDLKNTYSNLNTEGRIQHQNDSDKPLIFENFQNYESFYAEVYRQMFKILFSYGMQVCGNRELVKDSIQDLFSGFWKNERTLTKIKSIKPYLLKCLKRKIKRTLGEKTQLYVEGSFEFEISHEVKLIRDQQYLRRRYVLTEALKSLTERQREAIYLKFYGNLSYD